MSPRRSSKEPALVPGSPLGPIVEQLRTMARGLAETENPLSDAETNAFIRGKIEGLESAITLLQRAGALHIVTDSGQRLVLTRTAGSIPKVEEDETLAARVARLEREMQALRGQPPTSAAPRPMPAILATPEPIAVRASKIAKVSERSRLGLGRCERALLAVLTQRAGKGTTATDLAILSGYSIKSSGFDNALGALRSAALARGDSRCIEITDAGLELAEEKPLPMPGELLEMWGKKLGKAPRTMLQALVRARGPLTKEQLSDATDYSITSSGFDNAIGELRSLRLVADRSWPARAHALFLEARS